MEALNKLNKLCAICDAATPGSWYSSGDYIFQAATNNSIAAMYGVTTCSNADNAAFIATSRTVLPALIELVEALKHEYNTFKGRVYGKMPLSDFEDACAATDAARKKLEEACG